MTGMHMTSCSSSMLDFSLNGSMFFVVPLSINHSRHTEILAVYNYI